VLVWSNKGTKQVIILILISYSQEINFFLEIFTINQLVKKEKQLRKESTFSHGKFIIFVYLNIVVFALFYFFDQFALLF
jgi:hypothetical protein